MKFVETVIGPVVSSMVPLVEYLFGTAEDSKKLSCADQYCYEAADLWAELNGQGQRTDYSKKELAVIQNDFNREVNSGYFIVVDTRDSQGLYSLDFELNREFDRLVKQCLGDKAFGQLNVDGDDEGSIMVYVFTLTGECRVFNLSEWKSAVSYTETSDFCPDFDIDFRSYYPHRKRFYADDVDSAKSMILSDPDLAPENFVPQHLVDAALGGDLSDEGVVTLAEIAVESARFYAMYLTLTEAGLPACQFGDNHPAFEDFDWEEFSETYTIEASADMSDEELFGILDEGYYQDRKFSSWSELPRALRDRVLTREFMLAALATEDYSFATIVASQLTTNMPWAQEIASLCIEAEPNSYTELSKKVRTEELTELYLTSVEGGFVLREVPTAFLTQTIVNRWFTSLKEDIEADRKHNFIRRADESTGVENIPVEFLTEEMILTIASHQRTSVYNVPKQFLSEAVLIACIQSAGCSFMDDVPRELFTPAVLAVVAAVGEVHELPKDLQTQELWELMAKTSAADDFYLAGAPDHIDRAPLFQIRLSRDDETAGHIIRDFAPEFDSAELRARVLDLVTRDVVKLHAVPRKLVDQAVVDAVMLHSTVKSMIDGVRHIPDEFFTPAIEQRIADEILKCPDLETGMAEHMYRWCGSSISSRKPINEAMCKFEEFREYAL